MSRWSGWVALLWATAFFYLGVSSSPPVPEVSAFERIDLVGHAAASALLAILVGEWMLVTKGIGRRAGLGWAVLASAGLGVAIEVLQSRSPTRSFEVADLAADGVGAVAGVWLYALAAGRVRPDRLSAGTTALGVLAVVVTVASVALA